MNDEGYYVLCQSMWNDHVRLRKPYSDKLPIVFERECCPEPYILFNCDGIPRFVFLLTNPGSAMPHQNIEYINTGESVIGNCISYQDIAVRYGEYYAKELQRSNAGRRINAMQDLATLCYNQKGFGQIECIPYHSRNIPNKNKLAKQVEQIDELRKYSESLKQLLLDKTVIVISAVSSSKDIACSNEYFTGWLEWQAEIIGFDVQRAKLHPIVRNDDKKVTGALLVDSVKGVKKAFWLMMGSNGLPAQEGRIKIAEILRD